MLGLFSETAAAAAAASASVALQGLTEGAAGFEHATALAALVA